VLWLRRAPSSRLWGGILIGLVGVALILHPGREVFSPVILLGLASGLLLGVVFLTVGILSRTEQSALILFYNFAISSIGTTPLLVAQWAVPDLTVWILLLLIGLLLAGSQFTVILSLSKAPASVVSPLYYLSVVFTGIIDWIVWGHVPDWQSVVGSILVIGGGTWTVLMGSAAR
jgi:drug/metabolite transporter (DMT)-like permease